MKKVFNFLNVKTAEENLTQENLYQFLLKKEYRKQQELVFWSVFFSYMVFYFTRKQWTVFGSELMAEGVVSTSQYALIGLIFAVAYGISKFLTSPLSDTKSNKWLLSLGLIGAGVGNILLGLSWISVASIVTPIILSCVLMIVIGWVHSFGANPATRFFYNWFNHKSRRNRLVMWNVSHNIGSALATFIIVGSYTLFSTVFHRMAYFILPSAISIVFGIILLFLIKDNPEAAGLPSLKNYYNLNLIGENKQVAEKIEKEKPWRYYFVKYVLKNKFVWLLAISNMLVYTLRMGISDWSLDYLRKVHDYDIQKEGKWIYSMFDWGGLAGTLTVGLLANKFLKKFAPLTMIVILIATLALLGIWVSNLNSKSSIALLAVLMLLSGVIFIPQAFLPIMVSEFSHYKVISTSAGVLGIAGYVGDALMSKVIIGFGLMNIGWNAIFIFLISCGFIASLLLIPMFKKNLAQ